MKKIIFILMTLAAITVNAQSNQRPFHGTLVNDEYGLTLHINFYEQDVIIPGQELFGQMAGYMSKDGTSYCWLIVSSKIEAKRAKLLLSNDYGSEDAEAELILENDSLCTLKHLSGSTLKVPNKGKWQKLPKNIQFLRGKK